LRALQGGKSSRVNSGQSGSLELMYSPSIMIQETGANPGFYQKNLCPRLILAMGDRGNIYVYRPLRPLAVIDAELKLLTDGILEMIEWLRRGSSSSLTPIAPAKPCFPVRFCG
jgi:hypothetical protein